MTANRDRKRLVRERQARTGESYMTALRHVQAQADEDMPAVISTVEYIDVTEVAQRVGLRCRASLSPAMTHAVDVEQTLRRFHDVLVTPGDPALWIMRTVALRGVHVPIDLSPKVLAEAVRFVDQLREGAALSEHGRMLALRAESVRFIDQARKGATGISDHGFMLALPAVARTARREEPSAELTAPDNPLVVFSVWQMPMFAVAPSRPPLVLGMSVEDYAVDPVLELIRRRPPSRP